MARIINSIAILAAITALFTSGVAATVGTVHHLCHERGGVFFDVWASGGTTTMDRWDVNGLLPRFIDRNTYAVLHPASTEASLWAEGIAFAATMQTRNSWVNPEPNTEAYWTTNPMTMKAVWTFKTTIGQVPTEIVFRKNQCRWLPPPFPRLGARVCLQHGSTLFDVRTSPLGTAMHRWNMATYPPTYMDRNLFAQLHVPVPADAMWGEGVAFAAAMQTRHAWVNVEPNTEAFWETNPATGNAVWRFKTSIGGSPVDLVFRRFQCPFGLHPPAPFTPPPPTSSLAPLTHRVCGVFGSTFYDIRTDPSGTTMDRWNTAASPAALIDHNWFAALHMPSGPSVNWGEGVAFAATMQSRVAWVNTAPNTEAYWTTAGGDAWTFHTMIGDSPSVLVFNAALCSNAPQQP